MRQSILNSTEDNSFGLNLPVGLSHNKPVDISRTLIVGRTVVFHSLTHQGNLLLTKMCVNKLIRLKNHPRIVMMIQPAVDKPEVMKCRYHISHLRIGTGHPLHKHQALPDDRAHMIFLMHPIKKRISGYNLTFNILSYFRPYHSINTLLPVHSADNS